MLIQKATDSVGNTLKTRLQMKYECHISLSKILSQEDYKEKDFPCLYTAQLPT
jgi:hypothetical protein